MDLAAICQSRKLPPDSRDRFNWKTASKLKGVRWHFLVLVAVIALAQVGCQPVCQQMEPVVGSPVPIHRLSSLPSAFPSLLPSERRQEWANELIIGSAFTQEGDFYRAITAYKRALFLLPTDEHARRLQLNYNIALCYYLGLKYQEVLNVFESSELSQVNPDFPAFDHLLLMVYESYIQTKQDEKAECALEVIHKYLPEMSDSLELYRHFKRGELEAARCQLSSCVEVGTLQEEFALYDRLFKNPRKAQLLNALLPGAGYAYVGQKRSALTSFILNALFATAAYQFFHRGYPAAGAITTSLEMGWYLGGINGAGIEAQELNTRLYEGVARKTLMENNAFPVLMFETYF